MVFFTHPGGKTLTWIQYCCETVAESWLKSAKRCPLVPLIHQSGQFITKSNQVGRAWLALGKSNADRSQACFSPSCAQKRVPRGCVPCFSQTLKWDCQFSQQKSTCWCTSSWQWCSDRCTGGDFCLPHPDSPLSFLYKSTVQLLESFFMLIGNSA